MGKRITLRIDDQIHEKLMKQCRDLNLDASFVVREALGRYFSETGTADSPVLSAGAKYAMPPEAFALAGPYRAFSGDLRAALKKRLLDMLALAHSTADQYPRTKGVREAYRAILEAYHLLNGVGHES
jgi:hypothetical protein